MQRSKPLPVLPGYNFDTKIGQTKFNRCQHFGQIHPGVYYLTDKVKYGVDGTPIPFTEHNRYPSVYPRGEVPPWLAFDGQRLMFKAFFQEKWQSAYRIRVVTISFFLEDGTIKVSEPEVDNSGLEQGILVRRQRIPMPDSARDRFYDILDLNVSKEPEFFGRVYKIVDCDKFTRRFLNRCGIPVPDPVPMPIDSSANRRKVEIFPRKSHRKTDTLGQFLSHDRKVLRFYGYWDDRDNLYGVVHDLELHYYLADDTIEIKEILPPNSGRDTGFMLIKRIKLPKFFSSIEPIGSGDPFTVLNVLGDDIRSSRYIADALDTGKLERIYLKDSDLAIGVHLDVFGREVIVTDMDLYTKEYYRIKYGVEDFTPLQRPDAKQNRSCTAIEKYIPPYNGFGSYQDSLQNCFAVELRPPKIDFVKFYNYDKYGVESRVLRFRAKLISNIPDNNERHFIIRVFISDHTISIFELGIRNSGFARCSFQKRMKVMRPGQEIYSNKEPKYFEPRDFWVGARLNLCGFHFQLTSADVYALRYMELHCDKFPKANVKLIIENLRRSISRAYKQFVQDFSSESDDSGKKIVPYKQFREILCQYLGDQITEHEMITLARHYSSHEKKEFHAREYVRSLVHGEIRRVLWNDLDRLEEDIHHVDRARTGYLSRDELYTMLRGCRVPLDVELLNSMLDHICKNEEGKLDYNDLLKFLDIKLNPAKPIPPVNVKSDLWWASEREPDCGVGVDTEAFFKDLDIDADGSAAAGEIVD